MLLSQPDPVDFSGGTVGLGPYRLVRPIGVGGMARVYEGSLDSVPGVLNRVAIKILHPDMAAEPALRDFFIREAQICERLAHPNLVRVRKFEETPGLLYLVMEYVEGITVRRFIRRCRARSLQLPVAVIAEIGRQVCAGLHHAHTAVSLHGEPMNLVHLDIKPSNLMINDEGTVKVLDFGISSAHGEGRPLLAGQGTWGFMAPEQVEGRQISPATDVFALAAVLYELAALEPLFPRRDPASVGADFASEAPARRAAALPPGASELGIVLLRALQRDPEARYRSAASFGRALGGLVDDPRAAQAILLDLVRRFTREERGDTRGTDRPASLPSLTRPAPEPARISPTPAPVKRISIPSSVFLLTAVIIIGAAAWRLVTWPGADVR